jgi:hypothetical protein
MKPVTQTTFYDPSMPVDQQRGNCWSACLASLLELDIEEVPDFVQIEVSGGQYWWEHTLEWLAHRGYRLARVMGELPKDPYIMCGISPRSPNGEPVGHSVIYQDGVMIHDPHPSGDGITAEESAFCLVRIT